MAPRVRSHLNEQAALIVVVVAVTMCLDDHHFLVLAVTVPATIVVAVPVATPDDNASFLGLRRRSDRQYEAESRQRGECQYDLAHIFSSKIPMTKSDAFYQSLGGAIVPMTT
jgi:hypothetical protein